jgi:hypothetical protein
VPISEPTRLDEYVLLAEYDSSGNLLYYGRAPSGSTASQSVWQIRKLAYDASNNLVNWKYVSGDSSYIYSWDLRTVYSYF